MHECDGNMHECDGNMHECDGNIHEQYSNMNYKISMLLLKSLVTKSIIEMPCLNLGLGLRQRDWYKTIILVIVNE